MIIQKLIRQHLRHKDDQDFYLLQAQDAIRWMMSLGVRFEPKVSVLDLGCGHGVFGGELGRMGCEVTFADERNTLLANLSSSRFLRVNLDRDDVATLGVYDVVVCSNVLEHLSRPNEFIDNLSRLLLPQGAFYLSWTNWLSPWGGHDFSPFHYLGPRTGHLVYDKLVKRKRIHTPFETLYPTYIGPVLRRLRRLPDMRVVKVAPRYYTELSWIMRIPGLREFAAWNCGVLLRRAPTNATPSAEAHRRAERSDPV